MRINTVVWLLTLPYIAVMLYLSSTQSFERLPSWAFWLLICYFPASLVFVGVWSAIRKRSTPVKDSVPGSRRNRWWIKAGIVFYLIALLNGIWLTSLGEIPVKYAAVGGLVDITLIGVFVWLLRRSDRAVIAP